MGTVTSKVVWIGKATTFCVGLAVILAVLFGVATTALAAVPGDPLRLGRINTVGQLTTLAGSVAGPLLKVDNNGTGPALSLETEAGAPPMRVNADAGKVTYLNADRLDGKDAANFLAANGKATDAAHADKADTATSANSAATAGNADTLDGKDSADFQPSNPCPSGTMFHEGVCIEKIGRGSSGTATFANAQSFCLNDESRLPTVAELQTFRNRQGHDFTGTEYTSQV